MKTITLKISNKEIKQVNVEGNLISPDQALVSVMVSVIETLPYTQESSKLLGKVKSILDEAIKTPTKEAKLEDAEFLFLSKALKAATDHEGAQNRHTLKDRFWLDEVFRILEEAK